MIGKKVHHYQITEKLGEGGMGVVYKAEDTRLHRTVALKFLNQELVDDPAEQERLINEARSAASLNHPNICTIYEINEHDGRTFIAMEYVEGATLRDRVLSGRIDLADTLRYVIQIGNGLKQSHEQGIIHRDIKSANIMINRAGQAVIMDFGLARQTGAVRTDERLSSGGTSAYMSPEQARGEGVDERTDIWSIGIVLYETLAGQLPFRGDYEQAVIYSILNETPKPIRDLRSDVPDDVLAIVDRCLEKDPDDRHQKLDDLITDLRTALDRATGGRRVGEGVSLKPGRGRGLIAVPAVVLVGLIALFLAYDFLKIEDAGSEVSVPVAVADIRNDTGDPTLDGLSGMLITALEQSSHLDVMTRTGMFDVLKTLGREDVEQIDEATGQEICRAAGVERLVIPTIRRFGELYTIDLKVLDTRNNRYVQTRKEEGPGQESIPGMIDALAKSIRIDLEEPPEDVVTITPVAEVTTVHLDAYQAYFDGEGLLNRLDMKGAEEHFTRAVTIDSTFALAHFRIAYLAWWSQQASETARKHVALAMEQIDRMPERESYLVRSLNDGVENGFEAQEAALREMQEHYPNDKEMLFGIGDVQFHAGENDTAAAYFERVVAIDPAFDRALQHLTWAYLRDSRFNDAAEVAEQWARRANTAEAHSNLGTALFKLGERDRAMEALAVAEEMDPNHLETAMRVAEIYLSDGDVDESLGKIEPMMSEETPMRLRLGGGQILARCLYPYQGRYRDALAIFDQGMEMYATEMGDSSMLAQTSLNRATLEYWGWRDRDKLLAAVKATEEMPASIKRQSYYVELAGVYYILGDTASAHAIVAEHVKKRKERTVLEMRLVELAMTGRCDEARIFMESTPSLEELVGKSAVTRFQFMVGWCQEREGEYDGAIKNFEAVIRMPLQYESASLFPIAYYLLGKSYEAVGRAGDAASTYKEFLEIWADADEDLPARMDAKARYAALIASGSM